MKWEDTPPFRGALVHGVGDEQVVTLLEPRDTFLEALADLDVMKKTQGMSSDFLRNGNGASMLPSRVRPEPEPRKPHRK